MRCRLCESVETCSEPAAFFQDANFDMLFLTSNNGARHICSLMESFSCTFGPSFRHAWNL